MASLLCVNRNYNLNSGARSSRMSQGHTRAITHVALLLLCYKTETFRCFSSRNKGKTWVWRRKSFPLNFKLISSKSQFLCYYVEVVSGGFCKTRTKMITLARQSQKRQKTFNCVIRSQSRETAWPLVLLLISIEKVATNPGVLESDVYVCSITFKAKYLGCKEVTPIQSTEYGKLTYKSNIYSNRSLRSPESQHCTRQFITVKNEISCRSSYQERFRTLNISVRFVHCYKVGQNNSFKCGHSENE